MMMNIRKLKFILPLLAVAFLLCGCKVKYSFTGASISPDAKTVSIAYFPNNAPLVAPILSPTLTDALQDRFMKQTRLSLVEEDGDLAFEGEITGYSSSASSISGDEYAQLNRLTITVKVKFTNKFDSKLNYTKTFSQYAEYDSNKLLQEVESTLIPEIVEKLVDDIFNAAVSNW